MFKMSLLRIVEVWLTARLLASPTFHRAVRKVHKKVHEVRRGEKLHDPSETTGLERDGDIPKYKQTLRYFAEELRDQFRGTTKK